MDPLAKKTEFIEITEFGDFFGKKNSLNSGLKKTLCVACQIEVSVVN